MSKETLAALQSQADQSLKSYSGSEQEPGLEEIKSPVNPLLSAWNVALGGTRAGGKILDVTAALPRGAMAGALQLAHPDKDIFNLGELGQAYNPTNLKTYPRSEEIFSRAGLKDLHPSDVFPGAYNASGENVPYKPNKGGIGDPGIGGFGADMLLDLMNLSPVARGIKAEIQGPSLWGKMAREVGGDITSKVASLPGAQTIARMGEPIMNNVVKPVANAGSKILNAGWLNPSSVLQPTADSAYKMAYPEMVRALEERGVKNPQAYLRDKLGIGTGAMGQTAQETEKLVEGKLGSANDKIGAILQTAEKQGAKGDLDQVLENYKTSLLEQQRVGKIPPPPQPSADFMGPVPNRPIERIVNEAKARGVIGQQSPNYIKNLEAGVPVTPAAYEGGKIRTPMANNRELKGMLADLVKTSTPENLQGSLIPALDESSKLQMIRDIAEKAATKESKRPLLTLPQLLLGAGVSGAAASGHLQSAAALPFILGYSLAKPARVKSGVANLLDMTAKNPAVRTAVDMGVRPAFKGLLGVGSTQNQEVQQTDPYADAMKLLEKKK